MLVELQSVIHDLEEWPSSPYSPKAPNNRAHCSARAMERRLPSAAKQVSARRMTLGMMMGWI